MVDKCTWMDGDVEDDGGEVESWRREEAGVGRWYNERIEVLVGRDCRRRNEQLLQKGGCCFRKDWGKKVWFWERARAEEESFTTFTKTYCSH